MPLLPHSPEFKRIEKFLFREDPQPGDRVASETEVMEHFGITRYRARQAFDLLVQMGVLERAPRSGTIVKRLATDEMTLAIAEQFKMAGFDADEFNEARLMIETAILPFVIRRATPAMLAEMRSLIEKMRLSADDPMRADAFLMGFHLAMLQSCGNRVMEVFANVVRTYFRSTKHLVEKAPQSFFTARADLCEALVEAIRKGEKEKAEKILATILEPGPILVKKGA